MVTAKASKPRLPGTVLIQCTEPFPTNQCWKGGHQKQGGKDDGIICFHELNYRK